MIPSNLTDKDFMNLVEEKLKQKSARHGYRYNSTIEILGAIGNKAHELTVAICLGRGNVTTLTLTVLVAMASICVRASRSYLHNQEHPGNDHE